MSLLSDAMGRCEWQQFELDVIDELKAIETNDEMAEALDNKVQLAKRELELSQLQMKLMDFHACACFWCIPFQGGRCSEFAENR